MRCTCLFSGPATLALLLSSVHCAHSAAGLQPQHCIDEAMPTAAGSMLQTAMTEDRLQSKDRQGRQLSTAPGGESHTFAQHPKFATVFSTECTPYHDWQSVVLHYSWRKA